MNARPLSSFQWTADFSDTEIGLWSGLAVPQAWSLGIEISFYALAPILLNLRSRWLVIFAACSLGLKVVCVKSMHLHDPWTYRFFPFEIGYFLLGALAFRYRDTLRLGRETMKRRVALSVYLPIAVFVTVQLPLPGAMIVYPAALALALPYIFRATAKSEADRWIGELSYPFYIFHVFAIAAVGRVLPGGVAAWAALLFTLILSAAALALERRFIEPWRAKLARRAYAVNA